MGPGGQNSKLGGVLARRGAVRHTLLMIKFALAALLLASPAAAQTSPETPAALAAIPGVTVKWYDVTGTTPDQIRKSKKSARPAVPGDSSQRYDVLSTWKIETSWAKETGPMGCRVADPEAKFSADVSLPRLVPAAGQDETLLKDWAAFVDSLATYEAQFVRYATEHAADVSRGISAASCDKANDASAKGIAAVAEQVAALRKKSKRVDGAF
ncbi:MAG: DUF922 domain-containing protein [Sphingomonadales bacterium]|nr:MAG: DUF922 domain-containing protein [Sphingomonadales bacterium]